MSAASPLRIQLLEMSRVPHDPAILCPLPLEVRVQGVFRVESDTMFLPPYHAHPEVRAELVDVESGETTTGPEEEAWGDQRKLPQGGVPSPVLEVVQEILRDLHDPVEVMQQEGRNSDVL